MGDAWKEIDYEPPTIESRLYWLQRAGEGHIVEPGSVALLKQRIGFGRVPKERAVILEKADAKVEELLGAWRGEVASAASNFLNAPIMPDEFEKRLEQTEQQLKGLDNAYGNKIHDVVDQAKQLVEFGYLKSVEIKHPDLSTFEFS